MSQLLHVNRIKPNALQNKNAVPLILEYIVPPDHGPYLVSSSNSVLWIPEVHPQSKLRAAVRKVTVPDLYLDILKAVVSMGTVMEWGNVFPLTLEGVEGAVDYLKSYDFDNLEYLVPRTPDPGKKAPLMPPHFRPLIGDSVIPFRVCSWVPENTLVVVPKDRQMLGVLTPFKGGKHSCVLHNACRGMAVVTQDPNELANTALSNLEP